MTTGKITKRAVDALSPGEALFDTELKGFMVRARKGARVYGLKYVNEGRQRIMTLGEHGPLTPDQARALAEVARAEVSKGGDPQATRDAAKARGDAATFELFVALFERRHISRKKPRSAEEDRRLLRLHLLPPLARRSLASITKADVLRLKDKLEDRPIAFNRARALLHTMFERARDWELHTGPNPAAGVSKHPEKPRERFITAEEYARLFAALDAASGIEHPSVITCIRLLALTGSRLSEILKLEWSQVDFEHAALRLPDSKTGTKVIPLGAAAIAPLARLERVNAYVCHGDKSDRPLAPPQRQWRRIRKAAGLDDLRLHDLRHGFASVAAVSGESMKLLGATLGHRQAQTTERYAHLTHGPKREFADRTAGRIQGFADAIPK